MIYENEELLKSCGTNTSVIPEHVMSASEAALYVCESIESSYNKLFEEIGINELAVYESTGEMICYTEADQNESLGQKFINFFKETWEKIKGFFLGIITQIKDKIKENKEKMGTDIVNKIKSNISKVPNDSNFGEISDFSAVDKILANIESIACDSIQDLNHQILGSYKSNTLEEVKQLADDIVDKFVVKLLGGKVNSDKSTPAEKAKDHIKNLITTKKASKGDVVSNLDKMKDIVFGDSVIKSLNTMYKDERKCIDEIISGLKDSINEMKKIGDNEANNAASYMQIEMSAIKSIQQLVFTAHGACIDQKRKQFSQYRSILFKTSLLVAKYSKVKPNNESTDLFASQVAMVEAAFNW